MSKQTTYRYPTQIMPGVDVKSQLPPATDFRFIAIMRQLQAAQTALEAIPAKFTVTGTPTHSFPADPAGAYTGLATGLGGTPYGAVADLNTLRAVVSTLIGVVRQLVTDVGSV